MKDSKVIKEVMSRYDEARENWVRYYGTDEGFDTWFTNKITVALNTATSLRSAIVVKWEVRNGM